VFFACQLAKRALYTHRRASVLENLAQSVANVPFEIDIALCAANMRAQRIQVGFARHIVERP